MLVSVEQNKVWNKGYEHASNNLTTKPAVKDASAMEPDQDLPVKVISLKPKGGTQIKNDNRNLLISFTYNGQVFKTKAVKESYSYGTPFYKVALGSTLSPNCAVCWLQKQENTWKILMGEISPELKKAVTTAIEYTENIL